MSKKMKNRIMAYDTQMEPITSNAFLSTADENTVNTIASYVRQGFDVESVCNALHQLSLRLSDGKQIQTKCKDCILWENGQCLSGNKVRVRSKFHTSCEDFQGA